MPQWKRYHEPLLEDVDFDTFAHAKKQKQALAFSSVNRLKLRTGYLTLRSDVSRHVTHISYILLLDYVYFHTPKTHLN